DRGVVTRGKQEGRLAVEVPVDAGGGEVDAGRDLLDRCVVVAACGEHVDGRVHELLTPPTAADVGGRGRQGRPHEPGLGAGVGGRQVTVEHAPRGRAEEGA